MDLSATRWLIIFLSAVPMIIAITTHEAAHGYVAFKCGDPTAKILGRVSFNPFRHIDLIGTLLLPGMLFLTQAPFLFGYAKPVPVNFSQLRHPRRDMVLVAIAGPATNLLLAIISLFLANLASFLSPSNAELLLSMVANSVMINVVLAIFNMIPLPPLDGGRVAVGILPLFLSKPLANLERFGMFIMIGLIVIIPIITAQLGYQLNPLGYLLHTPVEWVIKILAPLSQLY